MRINKFVAQASSLSRRAADTAIAEGRVLVNGESAQPGQNVAEQDQVTLDGMPLLAEHIQTILLNKPVGSVVSRTGQGSSTIYDLLPPEFHHLNPVGRLDKNSSGLLLLTNDGQLAQQLTHPRHQKTKVYELELDKPLTPIDRDKVSQGVLLGDGLSRLQLTPRHNTRTWQVTMHEGRNRQIRRTFAALGYEVTRLHRTHFGPYALNDLKSGDFKTT